MQNKGIFHLAGKQNRITIELAVVNFGVEWSKGGPIDGIKPSLPVLPPP